VERMDEADEAKLSERLESFSRGSGVDEELRQKARKIADGYPRLLEWLNLVLLDDEIDREAILAALVGKQQEFLANILAEELLAKQQRGLRVMLERETIFDVPVPLGVLKSICGEFDGAELERHIDRARALGLLESGLNDGLVRVPKVLNLTLKQKDRQKLAALAVRELNRLWIETAPSATEEQQVEIHRLAILGGDGEIAVKMAQRLSNRWIDVSRYNAARTLCEETLALQTDSTIIHNLSIIYQNLGELNQARTLSQKSIEINRAIGDRQGEAASLHQMSIIYKNLGELNTALTLSQQSFELHRAIGNNRQGEAASLHQMSKIYQSLGELNTALTLSQQSFELHRAIGNNRQGEAASLHQMSRIYRHLGELNQALTFSQQSIEIKRAINDRQGEAYSLHQMSRIYRHLGKLNSALNLSQQSIEIYKDIGDRQGKAASLHVMSRIYQNLGELNQALTLSQQSIEIKKAIGNRQGEAASFHVMSIIYQNLGELNQALTLSQQSIEIYKPIGNRRGEAYSLHQMSRIYHSLGELKPALTLSQKSIEIHKAIGDRHGEAASLAQMAAIAGEQGDPMRERELYLQAAKIQGSIHDYSALITTLHNLGINNDEPDALSYLAQSLWLTLRLSTNLKSAITLIQSISNKIPTGDPLQALLGATAVHFCATRSHPELEQLAVDSHEMLDFAARQQDIATPKAQAQCLVTSRLGDPDYFLAATSELLESMVGDGWLFDRSAF
jgi:tetratricopeptide (TPR) repeat protein